MIVKLIFGFAMFFITLLIQFILFKMGKSTSFWSGAEPVFIMCILGLVTNDSDYLAGILGFVLGDMLGNFVGWHKSPDKNQ